MSSYGEPVRPFVSTLLAVCLCTLSSVEGVASTVQREIKVPKEILYRTAKAYVLSEFADGKRSVESVIPMADSRAGLLRFRCREGSFQDDGAVVEVIDLEPSRSRLRVTIPKDFEGRDQLMVDRIQRKAIQLYRGKLGKEVSFEAKRVFQSVRRFVFKEFVSEENAREDVILLEDEGIGFLLFVYRDGSFRDPKTRIQVVPLPGSVSRLVVSLPTDLAIRQPVLERRLMRAITADLSEKGRKERPK